METLKTTMRKKAKTVFAKFSMPFTLASKADEKLVLSVSSIDDVQFFITQKNDVAAVNFAFDALDGNNAVLILETGEEAQKNIGVYIDDFAESFGGPVKAFLPFRAPLLYYQPLKKQVREYRPPRRLLSGGSPR